MEGAGREGAGWRRLWWAGAAAWGPHGQVGSSVADIMVSHLEKMACGAWNEENMFQSIPGSAMTKT